MNTTTTTTITTTTPSPPKRRDQEEIKKKREELRGSEEKEEEEDERGVSSSSSSSYPIYVESMLSRTIELEVDECNPSFIQNHFLRHLREQIEGKCIAEGYVKPDSVRDVIYSAGVLIRGVVQFEVVYKCDVCFPIEGSVYSVKFKSCTKAGINADLIDDNGNAPVTLFLTRDLPSHVDNEHFLKYDDSQYAAANVFLKARILGTRFELNETRISAIAELV